jgi:predicted transcriptional regulator
MSKDKIDINPIKLQKALKGANYPATKDSLLKKAHNNQAPKEVVNFLEHIPNREYDTPADVQRHVGAEGEDAAELDSDAPKAAY